MELGPRSLRDFRLDANSPACVPALGAYRECVAGCSEACHGAVAFALRSTQAHAAYRVYFLVV